MLCSTAWLGVEMQKFDITKKTKYFSCACWSQECVIIFALAIIFSVGFSLLISDFNRCFVLFLLLRFHPLIFLFFYFLHFFLFINFPAIHCVISLPLQCILENPQDMESDPDDEVNRVFIITTQTCLPLLGFTAATVVNTFAADTLRLCSTCMWKMPLTAPLFSHSCVSASLLKMIVHEWKWQPL